MHHPLLRVFIVGLLAAGLVGCGSPVEQLQTAPAPDGMSDAEAFAAAEATYRAYVDALNQVDLSDPATFEPVYALTSGDLNAVDRKSFSDWHARSLALDGDGQVTSVVSIEVTADPLSVTIGACYHVADVLVLDSDGNSLVAPDRPPVQALEVHLVEQAGAAEGFSIDRITSAGSVMEC